MAKRVLPNIGLTAYWPLGDDTYKPEMDADFRLLSILVQAKVSGFLAADPGAPAQGATHVLTGSKHIRVYDDGGWFDIAPLPGWIIWNEADSKHYRFAAGAWSVLVPISENELPAGGDEGQLLAVGPDGLVWVDPPEAAADELPDGGTDGQVLAIVGGVPAWADPEGGGGGSGVPDGGTTGQFLAKASNADGDAVWVDAPEGGDGGSGSLADANAGFVDTNPLGAHRYWRARFVGPGAQGQYDYCYFPGWDFLDDNGVSIPGQNWMGREGQRPGLQAADRGGYVGFGAFPFYIATDLGSPKRIGGVMMAPRYGGFSVQAPIHWFIEGSDDTTDGINGTWHTYLQTDINLIDDVFKPKMRPFFVRAQFIDPGTATATEIVYAASPGGANLANLTDPARIQGPGNVRAAFDGISAVTDPYTGDVGDAGQDYGFDSRPELAEMRVTCRAAFPDQGPQQVRLSSSRDRITWTQFYETPAAQVYAGNETKSYGLPDLRLAGLPDTNGQGGKWLRVNAAGTGPEWFTPPLESLIIAVGDETTPLATGAAKVTFRMPYAFKLSSVRASVTTAASALLTTVGIKEGGAAILSTKITIDATEKSSVTAAVQPVISDPNLADDAEITIDVEVAGTDTAGLKVYLIGRSV